MSPIAVQAGHVIGTSARLPRHRGIVTVLHAYCGYICKRYKFSSSLVRRCVVSLFAIIVFHVLSLSLARGYRPFVPSPRRVFHSTSYLCHQGLWKTCCSNSLLGPFSAHCCWIFFFFFYVELVEREGEREVCRYYERQIPLAPNSTFIHGSLEVYRKMGTNYIATLTIVRCKGYFTFFYKNYNFLEFLKMLRIVRRSLAYFHAWLSSIAIV